LHRQRLLVVLQVANVVASLLLTFVLAAGMVQVWHGYGVIVVTGASWALGFPARRALIFDLLGTTGIANAVALDSVGMNGSRMIGPALAGAMIALVGVTGGFILVTCCHAIGLILLWTLHVDPVERPARSPQSMGRNLLEGFRYVGRQQVILADVCITVIMNFLLFPYVQMIPVLARDVLHVGPTMMGFLQGAEGVGAMIGSVSIATLTLIRYHGRFFVIGSMIALMALFVLSLSSWYIVSFPIMLILGIGTACFGTIQSTLVMLAANEEMRGRALGVISLAIGAGPLGSLLLGALADTISPVFALRVHALLGIMLLSCTVLLLPAIMDRTDPVWQSAGQEE
jgi:predicted MFS family arabinose efflux permease